MLPFAPNVMQFASGAGDAFAPALASLEPTIAEAAEARRRAQSYRDAALLLGASAGVAIALLVCAKKA